MDNNSVTLAEKQAEICGVFSNPRRILILWTLLDQEITVGEIATAVSASLQNTSHHLRLMKDKGILNSRRDGQSIYYRIERPELVKELLLKAPAFSKQLSFQNQGFLDKHNSLLIKGE